MRPVPTLTSAARTLARVFGDGGRVMAAHWPQLVGLFLIGWAARMALLWLAVLVSDVSPTIAVLMLPLAPMATLLSLVLMLRVTAETLPAFQGLFTGKARSERWHDHLVLAAQVLLPFLAIYVSQGLLKSDQTLFLYDATADEWMNTGLTDLDFGRSLYADGPFLIAMIVVAIVLRKAIALLDLGKRSPIWSLAATYLEVLWVVTLAHSLTSELEALGEWVTSRALIAGLVDWWNGVLALIPALPPVKAVLDAVGAAVGSLGNLVIVPVAWLAIGASVYGAELSSRAPIEPHDQVTQRLKRIPTPVRRVVAQSVEPVTTPIRDTLAALGKIAAAGVLPMVLFCIVFVAAAQVKTLVAYGFVALAMPGEPWLVYALSPLRTMVERLLYFVIVLALLGAAVNHLVLRQRDQQAQPGMATTA